MTYIGIRTDHIEEVKGEGESGTRWAHFRGPEGDVYEFVHHPAIGKPE